VAYLPERGDLAWINFDPQAGREQARNRPALVITGADCNAITGLLVTCPVTRTERAWRTRVPLVGTTTTGAIMIEQVKSIGRAVRGRVPQALLDDVKSRIATMLDL
jgi:mRNA interferase MazF